MTERELAWAAGLFEGEGTVCINKPTRRNCGHLIVSVVNTDHEVLEYFAARWPGRIAKATGLDPLRERPAWVWLTAARKAAVFLADIQAFIVTARVRTKIELGLAFQAQKTLGPRCRTYEYAEEQWNAYWWMRELNARGVQPEQQ